MGIFSLDLLKSLELETEKWKDEYEEVWKTYAVD